MMVRYKKAFLYALSLHGLLILLLAVKPDSDARAVLKTEAKSELGNIDAKADIVKAVTVDEAALNEQIEQLKQARLQAKIKEETRKKTLEQQAQQALLLRKTEQKRLEALKREAAVVALKRQEMLKKEKKALEELAQQKRQAEQAMIQAKAKQEQLEKEALKKAELEKARLAAEAKKATEAAAKQVRLTGEVDRYKALILNAISRHWILPESIKPGLSSLFRIRLAPNGTVLEATLLESSGDPVLDRSAQIAIYKASPLPVPIDAEVFNVFREIDLTVRPEQLVRG